MKLPKKCIVDTNVPLVANSALDPESSPGVPEDCVSACIEAVEHVINTPHCLVLDAGDEICEEYAHKLSRSGQPGVGDRFMKWVHDNRWALPDGNRVEITKNGNSYTEFPNRKDLEEFDPSDRKFIAVAYKHPCHPPILQAVDRKWWPFKNALKNAGITVRFLCPEYAKTIESKKKKSKPCDKQAFQETTA